MRSSAKAAPLKWRACCVHTQSTHHIKVSYSKIKSKAHFPKAQTASAVAVLLQNLPKSWGGGLLLPPVIPTPGASPEGRRVGNPRSKDRNMLRSIWWWWMQGCSKHCQSPSDLPKSKESGPGRGASRLTPVPWETEIWDMSLPIISFTEKQKGE